MAPWENGYVSCSNFHDWPAPRLDLPHPVDLWWEMMGYVISRILDHCGQWVWIYKWVRPIFRKAVVCVLVMVVSLFRVLRLAHARGRHWDRKRR